MFIKMNSFLEEYAKHKGKQPARFRAENGEEFVVISADMFQETTGLDPASLPIITDIDTIHGIGGADARDKVENKRLWVGGEVQEVGKASWLARMELEREIAIDDLPL